MYPLRTLWLLLTLVALVGGDAARGQEPGALLPGHVTLQWLAAHCCGPTDVAPTPNDDAIDFAELALRVRRRVRAEHGLSTLCVGGRSVPESCPPHEARDDAHLLERAACAALRREWARTAQRACARPAYGPELDPPACVVTFGIDGPRLVPLMLFD